jgi:hypothetical protein
LDRTKLSCIVAVAGIVLFGVRVRAQEAASASPQEAASASAQEAPPAAPNGADPPQEIKKGSKFGAIFSRPLHPVVEGVGTGGGIGAGIAYDFPARGNWGAGSKAVVTLARYWSVQIDGGYSGERAQLSAYTRVRNMNRLNFFGPGPDSDPDLRSTFTLRDPVAGVLGSVKVAPAVRIGGRVERLWPRVSSGRHPATPSIEEQFGEADAPGLTTQPRFGRYQGFVQVTAPPDAGWTLNQGGTYRAIYEVVDDGQGDRFDFHRVELEGRHKFAIFQPYHSLTLHSWISSAEPGTGRQVPFFLQQTLGGVSNLRSVDERMLGSDGNAPTLRGFTNLRFRDNHLLLLQAEYRWDVWRLVDATVFVDAGKAVSRRANLNLSGLKTDYGFSLSVMRGAGTVARMDVGLGGGEGVHMFFGIGGLLP